MSEVMILAPNVYEGEAYAREHGLDWRDVVTPRHPYRTRGRRYNDFVIVGDVRLDEGQWAALALTLLGAGEKVLERFFYAAQGKLPPPIELDTENVPRF
ncbi:hypothetical protein NYP18_09130 [Corynebacterium sp. YIM 101645]|uniref:Uncharacterized protein n=1 Tax=Corynebacterium lemuris TaxID=1859292 RepID=A0ABT2FX56_9CORY|nr:hypothetical protein [Corynebacterium lemuris]MCS5479821.1 hypothetical protein [Corynebacterium lemuris]